MVLAHQVGIGYGVARSVGRQSRAIGVPVTGDGPHTIGVEVRLGAEHLTGARIVESSARGEAAFVAIDPQDERIAYVHWIHIRWRVFCLNGVLEAGGLECL